MHYWSVFSGLACSTYMVCALPVARMSSGGV
jgi:hypothetical protein